MTTAERILPVLQGVYGAGQMVTALSEHLAEKIDTFERGYYRTRKEMILQTCWNWFAGGGTAEIAAERIEKALA